MEQQTDQQQPIQAMQMTVTPLLPERSGGHDAEIAVEQLAGGIVIYRRSPANSHWVEYDPDTEVTQAIKEHQFQISLNAILYNFRTVSGLYRITFK